LEGKRNKPGKGVVTADHRVVGPSYATIGRDMVEHFVVVLAEVVGHNYPTGGGRRVDGRTDFSFRPRISVLINFHMQKCRRNGGMSSVGGANLRLVFQKLLRFVRRYHRS